MNIDYKEIALASNRRIEQLAEIETRPIIVHLQSTTSGHHETSPLRSARHLD